MANDNDPYVFTSTTRQLQIRTTLMTDRAGESVEQFTICLPNQTVLTLMGAEAVEPTCATIKIIDDDCKYGVFVSITTIQNRVGTHAIVLCLHAQLLCVLLRQTLKKSYCKVDITQCRKQTYLHKRITAEYSYCINHSLIGLFITRHEIVRCTQNLVQSCMH